MRLTLVCVGRLKEPHWRDAAAEYLKRLGPYARVTVTEVPDRDVTADEAKKILAEINVTKMPIALEDFRIGLEVELEHGIVFSDANVTNNHPVLTGKIVMAHMKESLDYYQRLDVAEIEGDMAKAAAKGDAAKLLAKYRKLIQAKLELAEAEKKLIG